MKNLVLGLGVIGLIPGACFSTSICTSRLINLTLFWAAYSPPCVDCFAVFFFLKFRRGRPGHKHYEV